MPATQLPLGTPLHAIAARKRLRAERLAREADDLFEQATELEAEHTRRRQLEIEADARARARTAK
jgi:hypothetical protein